MMTPSGVISTIAGTGSFGFAGDGGPATSARFRSPTKLALDTAGNLYISDQANQRIRMVTPSGLISTVAGGFVGDGNPATSAALYLPYHLALDPSGNLYIGDYSSDRVRVVTPSGVISTASGSGIEGFGGDLGPATSAQLFAPYGVAVDSAGGLYIAEGSNNRVRKVTPSGVISTFAGSGASGFSGDGGRATSAQLRTPRDVALDTLGNLYIADINNHRIRMVTPSGVISTVAGNGTAGFGGDGGPASAAQLNTPTGVAVDAVGNLYIADTNNHRIRMMTPSGVISTIAGNGTAGFGGDGGPAVSASLNFPAGVAVDAAGSVYIADSSNQRIRIVTTFGVISTVAGSGGFGFGGDGGLATSAQLANPSGIAVDAAGNLFIADTQNARVRKVTAGPPSIPILLFPANGTTNVAAPLSLSWSATLGATSYDVSFGTSNPPPLLSSGVTATSLAVGSLTIGTRYYWKVTAKNSAGSTDSTIFSFVPSAPCVTLSTSTLTVAASGGIGSVSVNAPGTCSWTAASNVSWIVITSAANGTGNAAVSFSFEDNFGSSSRSGTLIIGGQSSTVVQNGAVPGPPTSCSPNLTTTLTPGFYIVAANLSGSAPGGFWGLEVIASQGQMAGGFNLGGAVPSNASSPGFGAFLLTIAQTVTATLNAQTAPNTTLTLQFFDANNRPIGNPVTGQPPLTLSNALQPGFYRVGVFNPAATPFTYQLGLGATFFSGGVDTGGYVGPGVTGFGAFFIPQTQEVQIKLYGRSTYGSAGAGDLTLTLMDANRNVIRTLATCITITTASPLVGGTQGSAYTQAFAASGGNSAYVWSTDGKQPQGLTLDPSSGVLSGTPTASGNYTFTVTVRDSTGSSASQPFQLNITPSGGGGSGNGGGSSGNAGLSALP